MSQYMNRDAINQYKKPDGGLDEDEFNSDWGKGDEQFRNTHGRDFRNSDTVNNKKRQSGNAVAPVDMPMEIPMPVFIRSGVGNQSFDNNNFQRDQGFGNEEKNFQIKGTFIGRA
jgi:hypothetical protein